ncbi:MAG: 3-deoxy-manno-octulosonate cytidylyltransferase [Gammaproteobacteria bacterium]|nr:3-deoxy-manno-octulosonate cytidylyltransferase [Gammaproteobacteria bacterium]
MFQVVIPARFASTRLPGKMLAPIAGRPLIHWVWERARASGAQRVVIATDDERIAAAARAFGAEVELTAAELPSGTDRVAEVARRAGFDGRDVIVNLQGDEPLVDPALIARLAAALGEDDRADIATAVAPIASLEEFLDPNCVKAVADGRGRALYFSRSPVPWPRDHVEGGRPTVHAGAWRHIGLYAYRVESLLRFASLAPTPLELCERLEQLRALEHGMSIKVIALERAPPPGIDTPADLARVRAVLEGGAGG